MQLKNIFTKKRIIFMVIFAVVVFLADLINFSKIVGTNNQYFTLFQFFGPIAGSFLGPIFGAISVLGAEIGSFFLLGKSITLINILRLAPMVLAAVYFGSKKKMLCVIVPIVAMALFILHPVGRQAWVYSLYWLIPIAGVILPKKIRGKLFFRSLGATFTAHAVGSIIWLYTIPMTASQWIGLVPVVAYERILFAGGITVSYIIFNNVLDKVTNKLKIPSAVVAVDKKYILN